jgi:hypothetical protein
MMVPRPVIACGAALIPLATLALAPGVLVPRMGDAMAKTLGVLAATLPVAEGQTETDTDPPAQETSDPVDAGAKDGGESRARGRARTVEAIDIAPERVVRVTARQLRNIGATDAVDTEGHAVGARLHGVGALGVGLADGDVVTSIDGRATLDAADATAAAIGAYASGEATAHATLLRDGRTVRVTVHIPTADAGARGV